MATKNHCLSGKNDLLFGKPLNDQYSNLNLNQKNHNFNADQAQSKSAKNNSRKNENYAVTKLSDFTDSVDLQAKRESSSWNKSNKHLSSNILNLKQKSEEKDELEKPKNTNRSTLSLHITAFENSIEADTSDLNECEIEASKTVKQGFVGSSFFVKNLFEFPRQQEDPSNQPEVMQFKSSQRLRNPNEENLNINKRKIEQQNRRQIVLAQDILKEQCDYCEIGL
uniref:Uncharacterized protein n=1 Tax=Panagrolaimus sp. ES5 TaxID=591445 RepID=A0AC34FUK7_9BILA